MEQNNLKWDNASNIEMKHLTPGVLDAIDEDPYAEFSASNLESKKFKTNIGRALSGLQKIGFIEKMDISDKYCFAYEDFESFSTDYQELKEEIQEIYMDKIKKNMNDFEEKDQLAEDIAERGIMVGRRNDGTEMLTQLRDDYREDTLEFLSNMDIIDDTDSREIASDERDIRHIEAYMTAKALGYGLEAGGD